MGKKILVVDDDRTLADTTAEILRSRGYQVFSAYDAYQATRCAHEMAPDLIILDILMPAGGGVVVHQNLKRSYNTQNIPVLFTSGLPLEEVNLKIPIRDPNNFFAKPYDLDKLAERIQQLIGA